MSGSFEGRLGQILKTSAATPGKKVMLVEGTGDTAFLTLMLDKPPFRDQNVFARFVIEDMGGKDAVLRTLTARPDFMAVVDRDTWSDDECEKQLKEHPGLRILPRFCIESFIICPDELEAVLPDFGHQAQLIRDRMDEGIRHACLWRAAQPLYEQLMHSGFNKALLRFPPATPEEMTQLVETWQRLLSPESIQQGMDKALGTTKNQNPDYLLRTFVHGKVFFKGVVEPLMKKQFPAFSNEALKRQLYKRVTLAPDLSAFLQEAFT